jgi:hypothetical protein
MATINHMQLGALEWLESSSHYSRPVANTLTFRQHGGLEQMSPSEVL